MKPQQHKAGRIISFNKLTPEQIQQFAEQYPEGYTSYIQKINKPSGEAIYVVPFETDDVSYMVKMEVKVDAKLSDEDFDKEMFPDTKADFEEIDASESEEPKADKEEFVLVHGDYSDASLDEEEENDDEDKDKEEDDDDSEDDDSEDDDQEEEDDDYIDDEDEDEEEKPLKKSPKTKSKTTKKIKK